MPAPDVQVLLNMIKLYKVLDKGENDEIGNIGEQNKSIVGSAVGLFQTVKHKVVQAVDNADEQIDELMDEVSKQLNTGNTPDNWLDFAIELGYKSKEAQKIKFSKGQSRSCETFQMMRSYILMMIAPKKDVDNDEYAKAYIKRVNDMVVEINDYKGKIPTDLTVREGASLELYKSKRNKLMTDLAYIAVLPEERIYISDACDIGELNYLLSLADREAQLYKDTKYSDTPKKQSICHNYAIPGIPYGMQNNIPGKINGQDRMLWFCISNFHDRYSHRLHIDAARFLENRGEFMHLLKQDKITTKKEKNVKVPAPSTPAKKSPIIKFPKPESKQATHDEADAIIHAALEAEINKELDTASDPVQEDAIPDDKEENMDELLDKIELDENNDDAPDAPVNETDEVEEPIPSPSPQRR